MRIASLFIPLSLSQIFFTAILTPPQACIGIKTENMPLIYQLSTINTWELIRGRLPLLLLIAPRLLPRLSLEQSR